MSNWKGKVIRKTPYWDVLTEIITLLIYPVIWLILGLEIAPQLVGKQKSPLAPYIVPPIWQPSYRGYKVHLQLVGAHLVWPNPPRGFGSLPHAGSFSGSDPIFFLGTAPKHSIATQRVTKLRYPAIPNWSQQGEISWSVSVGTLKSCEIFWTSKLLGKSGWNKFYLEVQDT